VHYLAALLLSGTASVSLPGAVEMMVKYMSTIRKTTGSKWQGKHRRSAFQQN
jgi:hypothetical protein